MQSREGGIWLFKGPLGQQQEILLPLPNRVCFSSGGFSDAGEALAILFADPSPDRPCHGGEEVMSKHCTAAAQTASCCFTPCASEGVPLLLALQGAMAK